MQAAFKHAYICFITREHLTNLQSWPKIFGTHVFKNVTFQLLISPPFPPFNVGQKENRLLFFLRLKSGQGHSSNV